jgi:hypothetical protein
MAQDLFNKTFGLVSQYSPLSVAKGSLIIAENCSIRRENIIENRRGYRSYGTLSNTPTQLMVYRDRVLAQNGTLISYDNGSGTFSSYSGTYSPPTSRLMRYEVDATNLYITTSDGIKVIQDVAGTAARSAGAPRCLDLSFTLTGATGFLANNFQCAYRAIFKRVDQNGNILIGYPSQRMLATNSAGGSRNVDLTVFLPSDAIAGDELQFYRTTQVTGVSADTAGDEMGLIFSSTLTSANITAGFIAATDLIVDDLRGETLYTSPSQEGIEGANEKPPLSKDLALFKSNFMMYANTSTRQRLYVTLVGTSGLTGNTITLAGTTYNFGASEIISGGGSPQVNVSATGTAAVDIDLTARSFVRVINRFATNTSVYAYYLSGSEDLPGQILVESRSIGAGTFTILSSNTTISAMFNPPPPVGTPNAKSTSSNDESKNGLFYSKFQQREHVPLANKLSIGPANSNILRVAALRDSLIIIKEEGVYRLTGEDPNSFSVTPLDLTVKCRAADSVVVLNNEVFMLANQGIVKVSDTGVEVISRAIEPDILPLLTFSNISASYGISYESDKTYILSMASTSTDSSNVQQYVYNTFTRCWTKYTFGITSGVHESTNDKLYFTKVGESKVFQERKEFSNNDYNDPESAVTITALGAQTVTFTFSGTPEAGWALEQGGNKVVTTAITLVSGTTWIATLLTGTPTSWATGAANIFPPVKMRVKYNAWAAEAPGLIKQVRQMEMLADNIPGNNTASSVILTFETDIGENDGEVQVVTNSSSWGLSPWGGFSWGGVKDNSGYPTYVPRLQQYCRLMNPGVRFINANEKISLAGLVLTYEMISERTGK